MFFRLAGDCSDKFPEHHKLGDLWLSHDHGWTFDGQSCSKGYHGNHCAFRVHNGLIHVEHDQWRSFPLWYDAGIHCLTNLEPTGRQIWADSTVCVDKHTIYHSYLDQKTLMVADLDTHIDEIIDLLAGNTQKAILESLSLPKSIFVTGGLDTLVAVALTRHTDDLDLITEEHFESDQFITQSFSTIKSNFWGYRQIHHWCHPRALITGACGDEYLMRGPLTVAIWSAWHDIDMVKYAAGRSEAYMSAYYLKEKNRQIFSEQWNNRHQLREMYPEYQDLVYHLLNILANDHQHWHLGHTLTLTPFRDLRLPLLVLGLPFENIVEQMIDGLINRLSVRKFWPELESLLSRSKNMDTKHNLHQLDAIRLTRKGRPRIL